MSTANWSTRLRERLGADFTLVEFDCDHMVPHARPARDRRRDPRRTGSLSMAAVTDEQVERVRALVASIPAGRVATYGDIASAAGLSSPRIVGWIMRTDSSDLPWHRVITASGRPAPHLATRQLELLRAEGVLAVDGRVPLREVRCEFEFELERQPHQRGGAGQARETPPPSTADAAHARPAGTSRRATTSAATPAARSTVRSARRRPRPRPARRRPTTPAAHGGGPPVRA